MCAIPSTISQRISRPYTRLKSSLVEISSRRAASDALSSSVDIGSSLYKAKLKSQGLDLILALYKNAEVIGVDEDVPAVFKRRKQIQRLLKMKETLCGGHSAGVARMANGRAEAAWRLPHSCECRARAGCALTGCLRQLDNNVASMPRTSPSSSAQTSTSA